MMTHFCLDELPFICCYLPNYLLIIGKRIFVGGGEKLQKTCHCKILLLILDVAHYIVNSKFCHC